jgi:hypothetical protein
VIDSFWFSLCDTLVLADELPLQLQDKQEAVRATAASVAGQINCLPVTLRLLTQIALSGFQFIAFIKHGKRFADLPVHARKREIELWIRFDLIPMGKLLLSIRSLCLLHFFEQAIVQASLDKVLIR